MFGSRIRRTELRVLLCSTGRKRVADHELSRHPGFARASPACARWSRALSCYTNGADPPLAPVTWEAFQKLVPYMMQTKAYYDETADATLVCKYMRERLPCAMGQHIFTDVRAFRAAFGFDAPLYRSMSSAPPALGVFTRVPVRVGHDEVVLSIYHMVGPDLCAYADGSPTADLRTLIQMAGGAAKHDELLYAAARMHATMWYLAFAAAHEHGFTKLADVMVGGGAFLPTEWQDFFKTKIHNTAMYLIGYGSAEFAFPEVELVAPPERVPLDTADGWRDVLHVNAWCHSSFLGNGNRVDNTLDGAWGRCAPIAPLAWPLANPYIALRPVSDMPQLPLKRPTDRLCGKPPSALRQRHA